MDDDEDAGSEDSGSGDSDGSQYYFNGEWRTVRSRGS